jgi:protein-tyrosine sulfotransferase
MRTLYDKIKYKYVLFPLVQLFRLFARENRSITNPHFFIIGSGRNGSTLLAAILNAHKDIFIPPEQFVLPYAILRRYVFFFWSGKRWANNVKKLFSNTNKTIKWDIATNHIAYKQKDVSYLVNNIFNTHRNKVKPNSIVWGDKSPLNTNFIKYIYPEFTKAKYIFLVRDPRDVALSYKKYLGNQFFTFGIWKWRDSVKAYEYLQARTEVLLVKYEDLVHAPAKEISKIIAYLNLKEDDSNSSAKVLPEQMGVEDDSHHQNLKKPISPRSVGNWKNELSEKELNYFLGNIKNKMKSFGYSI